MKPPGHVRQLSVDIEYEDGTSGLLIWRGSAKDGKDLLEIIRTFCFETGEKDGSTEDQRQ